VLAKVVAVDANEHRVLSDDDGAYSYDPLVLATGARHAYFGHGEWAVFAPGLKTLEDATTIRRRIFLAFGGRNPRPIFDGALVCRPSSSSAPVRQGWNWSAQLRNGPAIRCGRTSAT